MIPHMVITVNERVVLDADLKDWQQQPPETLKQYLKPGPEYPWIKPVMVVLADSALANMSVNIHVRTGEGRWTMEVSR